MHARPGLSALFALLCALLPPLIETRAAEPLDEQALKASILLPEGWSFSVYARGLGGPRRMALAPGGDLLVSLPGKGAIARLSADRNGDGSADEVTILAQGLDAPHGLLLEENELYVAEKTRITRFHFNGAALASQASLIEGLPAENAARTLKRGADGRIYVSIAAGCNACAPSNELSGTMAVVGDDGQLAIFARGLRQAEGFDWLPTTQMLYALDAGRDGLGEVIPPDELNLLLPGEHYGWPFRYGINVKDPEWGDRMPALLDPILPAHVFDAHSAPLAIRFLHHSNDPELKAAALVTKHGSDSPEIPSGFEIVSLHWHDDGRIEEEKFMTGCLKEKRILCRPVDLVEASDGTLFVSDDFTGAIYRLTYAR